MNDEQLIRYSRHLLLDGFDAEGQEKLLDSHVLIVGAGGLGCPAALYLAGAGVGKITLLDHDIVDLSNLQRQIAHGMADIEQPKVDSLKASMLALNPDCKISAVRKKLTEQNAEIHIKDADLVLDCSDNFPTRFLLNATACRLQTPLIIGAAQSMEGQILPVSHTKDSPCYECLFKPSDDLPEINCATSGVLSPVVGIIGSYQALLAIKMLTGFGRAETSKLHQFDFYTGRWHQISLYQDSSCALHHQGFN